MDKWVNIHLSQGWERWDDARDTIHLGEPTHTNLDLLPYVEWGYDDPFYGPRLRAIIPSDVKRPISKEQFIEICKGDQEGTLYECYVALEDGIWPPDYRPAETYNNLYEELVANSNQ